MRHFYRLMIAASLALGALLPGAAEAQYWNKPGYGYAPPPPVYYVPPRPAFLPPPIYFAPPPPRYYAPPVYYAPRPYHGRPYRGHRRHW
jgi:hypothetical protein